GRAAAVPKSPPPPQPLRELRFPPFAERTLGNGLRLIAIERHTDPEVSLRLLLPAGMLFEPKGKAGLAGATADLLTQGTAGRTAQQIAAAIDGVGGTLDASSGADFVSVSAAVTSDQFDLALELLAEVVLHPSFPAAELERWRRQSLSSLELARANPAYLANVAFQRLVFGAHPYGFPARGTPESLRGLTRDDLAAFHRERYRPDGAILAVVGDFRPAPALAAVERAFGGWARGAATRPPALEPPVYQQRRVVVIDKPDSVQTQIRVGQAALAYDDPDFFVAEVYRTVLGGGSFARLFREIRVKRGLAYGAYCRLAKQLVGGSFVVSTSTKTASTVEALRLSLDELAGMGAAPPPAAELEEAKTYLNGAFPLEIESAGDVADRVLNALGHGRDRAFLDTYRDRIDAVTAADVQRFGRGRIQPDRSVVVLVGNAAAFGPELAKQLGPFTTIPAAELDPLAPDLRRPAAAAPAPAPAPKAPPSPPAPPPSSGSSGG
ncbi:MAG TPA: pitrilysin family protein, partial [Thermoanaerobaculia bacterium]|nr:pitrilysin family protein [Thermoanaerobaculia bacterium]